MVTERSAWQGRSPLEAKKQQQQQLLKHETNQIKNAANTGTEILLEFSITERNKCRALNTTHDKDIALDEKEGISMFLT